MLASQAQWSPTISLKISLIRKATATQSKFVWSDVMEREYSTVSKTLLEQIRLTPYNPDKTLRLIIVLFQWIDELNPDKGAVIINGNSSRLKENQLKLSPIKAEGIGLDFACIQTIQVYQT